MLCFVYLAKYVEDWFGYGKLKLFCHMSATRLNFNIIHK